MAGLMQIGEVAHRLGLSLRSIRHYEDVGLVIPSARSAGGFRLYAEADVDRLRLVLRMKPLGFALEEMRELLGALDDLDLTPYEQRGALLDRLGAFHAAAQARVQALREQLQVAQDFTDVLDTRLRALPG